MAAGTSLLKCRPGRTLSPTYPTAVCPWLLPSLLLTMHSASRPSAAAVPLANPLPPADHACTQPRCPLLLLCHGDVPLKARASEIYLGGKPLGLHSPLELTGLAC